MNTEDTFAHRVRILRRKMGLDQSSFAQLLHIGRTYLSNIETGREPSQTLKDLFYAIEREYYRGFPTESETMPSSSVPTALDQRELSAHPRERLKSARLKEGYSVAELAKALGYSIATYQEIEDGRSNMGEKMIKRAAKLLNLDVSDLMEGSDEPVSRGSHWGTMGAEPDIALEPGMRAKYIPLLSWAQCGEMMAWDDTGYTQQGWLVVNCKDPKAFAVTLSGDSMTDRYKPGDVATVYPSKEPRNGGLVIARLTDEHGGGVFFKEYHTKGDKITLKSYNPEYPPREYSREQFVWIYPVAAVTHNLM